MGQADSGRVSVRISEETVWGETPATPTMARLPILSNTIGHKKATKQSAVLRSDRMLDAQIQTGVSADGDINIELRFGDFEKIFQGAFASTYATASKTGAGTSNNLAFAAASGSTQVITGQAGDWASFTVGAWVRVKSAAQSANNGVFKITAVDSTTLTVANAAGVVEAASVAVLTMKTMRNGTTYRSFLIEKQYEDLTNNYVNFRGMRVSKLSLSVASEAIITGTVSFMGKSGYLSTSTVSGSLTNPSSNDSMSASTNVATIYEGGVALTTAIKSMTLVLDNAASARSAVANVAAIGIRLGTLKVSGTLEAYYEDQALITKVFNHSNSSIAFLLNDPQGNTFVFTVAQIKTSGNQNDPDMDQDVMLPITFDAEKHTTDLYEVQIDALAA